MKILTAETDLTSATNISKVPVVRIYNSDSSAITLTRKDNTGTTIGSYSVPPSKVIYCEKSYTDTLEGGAALKATGVGYSEELDIICLGNGGGSSFDGVTTNLYIHYDFSDTNCWNRQSGTNTDDYTIHNLANDYNDGLFRSRTDSGDDYRNASDSPCITFNSSDGGGCVETIPSNHSGNEDDCAIFIPGSYTSTNGSSVAYNATTVAEDDANNLFNIGTDPFTIEFWWKIYLDYSGSNQTYHDALIFRSKDTSGNDEHNYMNVYDAAASSSSQNRFRFNSDNWFDRISISGAPSSGAAWSDWNHMVISRASTALNDTHLYYNNSLVDSVRNDEPYSHMTYARFCEIEGDGGGGDGIPMRLGIFRFYRGKALTASEVTENWNAQKSRFGY